MESIARIVSVYTVSFIHIQKRYRYLFGYKHLSGILLAKHRSCGSVVLCSQEACIEGVTRNCDQQPHVLTTADYLQVNVRKLNKSA